MNFKSLTLAHSTMVGTFVIEGLPESNRKEFVQSLRECLSEAVPTPAQRDTNVVSQELLVDEEASKVPTCMWSLRFNGIHAPDAVRNKCQSIYESIQDKVEAIGKRKAFQLETLEGAWAVVN